MATGWSSNNATPPPGSIPGEDSEWSSLSFITMSSCARADKAAHYCWNYAAVENDLPATYYPDKVGRPAGPSCIVFTFSSVTERSCKRYA